MPVKPPSPPDDRQLALRVAEEELSKAVLARRDGAGDAKGVLRAGRNLKKLAGSIAKPNRKTWLR